MHRRGPLRRCRAAGHAEPAPPSQLQTDRLQAGLIDYDMIDIYTRLSHGAKLTRWLPVVCIGEAMLAH